MTDAAAAPKGRLELTLRAIVLDAVPGVYLITGSATRALLDVGLFPSGGGTFVLIIND